MVWMTMVYQTDAPKEFRRVSGERRSKISLPELHESLVRSTSDRRAPILRLSVQNMTAHRIFCSGQLWKVSRSCCELSVR